MVIVSLIAIMSKNFYSNLGGVEGHQNFFKENMLSYGIEKAIIFVKYFNVLHFTIVIIYG